MFSQVLTQQEREDYSVNDKLREIDVANENVHKYNTNGVVAVFRASAAYAQLQHFLQQVNTAIQGVPNRDLLLLPKQPVKKFNIFQSSASEQQPADTTNSSSQSDSSSSSSSSTSSDSTASSSPVYPASFVAIDALLTRIENCIEPHASRASNSRFGHPGFRHFLQDIKQHSHSWLQELVGDAKFAAVPPSADSLALQRSNDAVLAQQAVATNRNQADDVLKKANEKLKQKQLEQQQQQQSEEKQSSCCDDSAASSTSSSSSSSSSHTHASPAPANHEHSHCCSHSSDNKDNTCDTDVIAALQLYLHSSFGDERRIDYGTGHELNFLCFLYSLSQLKLFSTSAQDLRLLVGLIFLHYLRIVRRLQVSFLLEPAGSRGVWGLDDYAFLPFLFGAAQLIEHKHIKPKSVRYSETLEGFKHDYIYLDAVQHIMSVKACSFAEHSPMLNDITVLRTWKSVNDGLIKMYQQEVLGKFAVVQHFIYTPFLPRWPIKPIELPSDAPAQSLPNCCDSIHFPSSLAAKQELPVNKITA